MGGNMYYEFVFYDHLQREDEDVPEQLGAIVCLVAEIICEDDNFYNVRVVSCDLSNNSTQWDIIKSAIISKKKMIYEEGDNSGS